MSNWMKISDAVRATGIPDGTIHGWVNHGLLEARGTPKEVDLDEVLRVARERAHPAVRKNEAPAQRAETVVADVTIAGIPFEQIRMGEKDGSPTFCARDIMDALGLSQATRVTDFLGELEQEAKQDVDNVHTPGGPQVMAFITLEGVFYCTSKCRANPKAKELDRWARKAAAEKVLGKSTPARSTARQMAESLLAAIEAAENAQGTATEARAIAVGTHEELQATKAELAKTEERATALEELAEESRKRLDAVLGVSSAWEKERALRRGIYADLREAARLTGASDIDPFPTVWLAWEDLLGRMFAVRIPPNRDPARERSRTERILAKDLLVGSRLASMMLRSSAETGDHRWLRQWQRAEWVESQDFRENAELPLG